MVNRLNGKRSFATHTVLTLALVALALRAFIPSGTMLDRDAESGALVLSICLAGGGVSETTIDIDLGDGVDHEQPDMRGDCPFASAAAPVLPTPDTPSLAPVLSARFVGSEAVRHDVLTRVSRPPLPARGPPTHT